MSEQQPNMEVRQFTVGADDDGIRLDRWFKRHLPQIGFGMVSKWARTGQVRVDGKRAKPEDRLAAGRSCACRREAKAPPSARNAASLAKRISLKRAQW